MLLPAPSNSLGTFDFMTGGGEMGALMRPHDWSRSSLGEPAIWPQPLRTAVRLLNTGHPMYIWWGADGACLYNDAYRIGGSGGAIFGFTIARPGTCRNDSS